MKNLIFNILFFFFSVIVLCGYACKGNVKSPIPKVVQAKEILGMPIKFAQGYLILDKKKHPNVSQWELLIQKNNLVSNKNKVEPIDSTKLNENINYWRIPKKYLSKTEPYAIVIKGIDEFGKSIIQTEPIWISSNSSFRCTGCNLEFACSWECLGRNYAYKINAWKKPNGGEYSLELTYATDYCDEDSQICYPYYYYAPMSAFPNGNTDPNIIGPINTAEVPGQYCSATGGYLNGYVYGIPKELGPWDGTPIYTDFLIGNPPCADNINAAIMIMNNPANGADFSYQGNTRPSLSCAPSSCGDTWEWLELIDGFVKQRENKGTIKWVFKGGWKAMLLKGWDTPFHQTFSTVILKDLNDITSTPVILDFKKSFDNNGKWIGKGFKTNSSLYYIGLVTNKGKYVYKLTEIEGSETTSFSMEE